MAAVTKRLVRGLPAAAQPGVCHPGDGASGAADYFERAAHMQRAVGGGVYL